jgi:hypothetical protein
METELRSFSEPKASLAGTNKESAMFRGQAIEHSTGVTEALMKTCSWRCGADPDPLLEGRFSLPIFVGKRSWSIG